MQGQHHNNVPIRGEYGHHDRGVYELDAQMESVKFYNGGSADVTLKDGGNDPFTYEVGSNLTLW